MNKTLTTFLLALFFAVLTVPVVHAFGLELKLLPALINNSDFNNQNTGTKMGFGVGMRIYDELGQYKLPLKAYGEFNFLLPSTHDFGTTTIKSTGITGSFKEKIQSYAFQAGLSKAFLAVRKTTIFAGLGVGFHYQEIKSHSFLIQGVTPYNLGLAASSLHFATSPHLRIEYALTHKLHAGLGIVTTLIFPDVLKNPVFLFPLELGLNF